MLKLHSSCKHNTHVARVVWMFLFYVGFSATFANTLASWSVGLTLSAMIPVSVAGPPCSSGLRHTHPVKWTISSSSVHQFRVPQSFWQTPHLTNYSPKTSSLHIVSIYVSLNRVWLTLYDIFIVSCIFMALDSQVLTKCKALERRALADRQTNGLSATLRSP